MICRHAGCTAEATTCLEAAGAGGLLVDAADICEQHRVSFLEGWDRMQAAAGALRDQGVSREELSRIMCKRVADGEFS